MNINAFGTDNFLRYTIRTRMKTIKEDDKVRLYPHLRIDQLTHTPLPGH